MANLMTVTSQSGSRRDDNSKGVHYDNLCKGFGGKYLTGDLVCWAQETQFSIVKFRANACDLCCCRVSSKCRSILRTMVWYFRVEILEILPLCSLPKTKRRGPELQGQDYQEVAVVSLTSATAGVPALANFSKESVESRRYSQYA